MGRRWIVFCCYALALLGCAAEENRIHDAKIADTAFEGSLHDAAPDHGGDLAPVDLPPPDLGPQPGLFELQTAQRTLQLWWRGDGTVRLHYLPLDGPPQPERGWTFRDDSWPSEPLPATDGGDAWVIETTELTIRVHKADASVRIDDRQGNTLYSEKPASTNVYRRKVMAELPADAHIYGLGEKLGPLDKRGMALRMWNTDALDDGSFTVDEDPLYQSIPYFIVHRPKKPAYGIYLASTFETHFDLGKTKNDELSFETSDGDLDYVFIYGPQIKDVIRRFTQLVGRPPLPPLWSLGYHQCKWSYSPEQQVRDVTNELRARKIPCDGIWLDIDYMDGFRSFTFSPSAFPNPAGLLSDLAQQGFKTTVIIDPGIKHDPGGSYTTFDEGLAGDHFVKDAQGELVITPVWPGDAVFPDFTAERTRSWWGDQIKTLVDVGVRGVWIDMNEPATFVAEGFPLDSQWAGEGYPTDHRETHNVFALLMARATRAGLAKWAPDRRPFVLTRAGFAGIQRYAAVWAGDTPSSWEHLAMTPATLMNMGLSGVAFVGSDVGGFSGDPGGELYARWIQLGSLSPFFRTHVATNNPPQEPWSFGPEVETISREAIELRYRRLPYLYSLMREAQRSGAPPLRPLVYEFPNDATTATLSDQLMLGEQLLAAPVLAAGQTLRRLYLPQGTWTDYHSRTTFVGPAWVHVAAPLDELPLFVRENSILPAWDVQQYVGEKAHSLLYLDLYPVAGGRTGAFDLYLDQGDGTGYATGAFQLQPIALETTDAGATLTIDAAQGSYRSSEERLWLVFHGVDQTPSGATRDGQPLAKLSSLDALRGSDGFFYDAQAHVGHVSIALPRQGSVIALAYDARRPAQSHVDVRFEVTLPAASPATIYFASTLDAWVPDAQPMVSTGLTSVALELQLQAGEVVRYKYTGGSWETVERGTGCATIEDRELQVVDEGGFAQRVTDTVQAWADQCQ